MNVSEEVQDANIRHAVYLQRYSTQTVRKIIRLLNRIDKRLVERLQREDLTDISRKRLDRMLEGLREINIEAYKTVNGEFRSELRSFARYEAGFQGRLIQQALPIQHEVAIPAANQLYSAVAARPFQGRLLRDWTRELEANAFKRLRDAVRMGVVEGRTTPELIRQVRGTRANGYKDGILSINRRGAEYMVRTAVNHTANVAREELYRDNDDLIKGVKWVSTLDGRTSAVCRARDGEVYKPGKGPRPPAHGNCRSTTTPVLNSWKELGIDLKEAPEGTRASMNGQVPANLTYQEWLKAQPNRVQDDTLGKGKADLFRAGLDLDKFVDKTGQEYTLEQLEVREADIFDEVNVSTRRNLSNHIPAIRMYTGNANYKNINGALRGERTMTKAIAEQVDELDKMFEDQRFEEVTTLYRGMNPASAQAFFENNDIRIGGKITEPAFLSASRSEDVARQFAGAFTDHVIVKIETSRASRSLDIAEFSQYPNEREVLSARNMVMKVLSWDPEQRILRVELLNE